MKSWLAGAAWLLEAVAEVAYPERCALCGEGPVHQAWEPIGLRVPGLRPWDRPHLCRDCWSELFATPYRTTVPVPGGSDLPVLAAARTTGPLVRVVGAWKYHGVRGLAWPLARALVGIWDSAITGKERCHTFAPVPLHRGRRRQRGFNQAEVLVRLVASSSGGAVADLVRRRRDTGQQARLRVGEVRTANMAEAFIARLPAPERASSVILVDDLVTSGATVAAVAVALYRAGWRVAGVLALGAVGPDEISFAGDGAPVDTPEPGF